MLGDFFERSPSILQYQTFQHEPVFPAYVAYVEEDNQFRNENQLIYHYSEGPQVLYMVQIANVALP